jgi:hypothetical protein
VIRFDALVGRALRAAGVDAVYGHPYGSLAVVPVANPEAALLLAQAHVRVHRAGAAVSGGDGLLRLLPAPGPGAWSGPGPFADGVDPDAVPSTTVPPATVTDVASLTEVVHAFTTDGPSSRLLRLGVDPDASVAPSEPSAAPPPDRWTDVDDEVVDALRNASRVALLVGPGVVECATVPELHDLAAVGGLAVVNTWGAKGVFDWRSRHHGATAGLQVRDFPLAGLDQADLVLVSGLDPHEAPPRRWQGRPWRALAPTSLGALAERWPTVAGHPAVPPLRQRLAAVTQRAWGIETAPLPPSRVTLHYAQCLEGNGMVAADPGVAGFWVARTFATTAWGRVHVPAERHRHGWAAACTLVARLRQPGRPVLAVVDAPLRPAVVDVLDAAASLGVAVPLEVWDPDGDRLDASGHRARLQRAVLDDTGTVLPLATDPAQLADIVEAAGAVVAWS